MQIKLSLEPLQNWLPHQKPLLIAGPCSAETEHQVLETARLIKNIFPNFIYRAGLWKPRSRAGNFAMQNADLLLILGSSLGSSVIGYEPKQFSPKSYKIMVDIDADEYNKNIVHIDEAYNTSLNEFFGAML